ncbi:MAG: MFS transporter [Bdellovibrionaceae bacterium]|nr:MFS transporter [Pseudobdellovibrionaceae bacterium]
MKHEKRSIVITVVVAALGYFVDIYDLLLFGIVRMASLRDIGVPEDQLLDVGIQLINAQMAGLLVGGILWGVWGDKRGRLSVLFASIFLYSLANIANAFVVTPGQYAVLRFVAGVGLAGELGAAITLVAEVMSKESRGIGTTVVAAVGVLGAVLAAIIGEMFHWKTAYIIGGVMGLSLLVLRIRMLESGLFKNIAHAQVSKGDFLMLFRSGPRFWKYLSCILIGVPIWCVIGIFVTFSPELARFLDVTGPIQAGTSIMMAYIGLSVGDVASGLLSQLLKSRKKVVALFLFLTLLGISVYARAQGMTPAQFYALCGFLGFAIGYWAMFVTIGAEQFGTNLRATVATSVPNFVRGSLVPLTLTFNYLSKSHGFTLLESAVTVGLGSLLVGALALWKMQETFGKDLDYLESERGA